jgi:hypothetical protein
MAVGLLAIVSPETGCESTDDAVLPADAATEGASGDAVAAGDGASSSTDSASSTDAPSLLDVSSPKDAPSSTAEAGDGASSTVDAGDGGQTAAPGPPTFAQVRVANWSPDAPPVDFCLAQHGSGVFVGPFVAALVAADADAGTASDAGAGLAFPSTSAYALVTPGTYDARIVVGGGCSAKIAADDTMLPALAAGSSATIALMGDANPLSAGAALHVVGFLDDGSGASAVALRFIHAAPDLASVDVGTVSGTAFKALFSGIPFGQASAAKQAPATDGSAPPVDMNGYLSQPALSGVSLRAQVHGGGDGGSASVANAPNVSVAAGSVVTVVVIGGAASTPLGLLECVDNAGTVGPLSNCSVISQ